MKVCFRSHVPHGSPPSDALFCLEREAPGNKLVTLAVALQGLDDWAHSGSSAAVLLWMLCDRVFLPGAEAICGQPAFKVS